MQSRTLVSVRFNLLAISPSDKPLPTKRQMGPSTPILSQKTRMSFTSTFSASSLQPLGFHLKGARTASPLTELLPDTCERTRRALVHPAHAAAMTCADSGHFCLFLDVGDQDFGGQHECNDGRGVLQGEPSDLGRINHACF